LVALLISGIPDDELLARSEISDDLTLVEHAISYGLLTPELQLRIKALQLP
jgi:hypothetical protein